MVLEHSTKERRVLLTFDKDFGELVYARGAKASCGVVLFRVLLPSPNRLAHFIVETIGTRNDWEAHFSVVEPGRIRMRPLPS